MESDLAYSHGGKNRHVFALMPHGIGEESPDNTGNHNG
ncbi:MAG: hypothetical protein ACD_62C00157G0002 [uncultured bacterium]|nr:MAG: hypothetical protein ACD_62C00157G0002 [uncultured bacterium]